MTQADPFARPIDEQYRLMPGAVLRLRNMRHYTPKRPKESGATYLDWSIHRDSVFVVMLLGQEPRYDADEARVTRMLNGLGWYSEAQLDEVLVPPY